MPFDYISSLLGRKFYNLSMGVGWLIAGLLAPKIYGRVLTTEQRRKIENFVGLHHGEYGLAGVVAGMARNNPNLALFCAGLTIDDWKDRNKWFNGAFA